MSCGVIHPTAVVSPDAQLAPGVKVGAYAVIGDGVVAAEGCAFEAHAVVEGPTTLGPGNRVHSFAAIGGDPQDKRYQGEATRLEIGENNVFREFCTVNRGTVHDGGVTRIGAGGLFMSYSHVAHDCQIGDNVVLANCATLAGHVHVGDGAVLGGLVAVHQGVHIGQMAFVAGGAMVERDVLSYCRAAGDRARLVGINIVALKRAGWDNDRIRRFKACYRQLFRTELTVAQAVEEIAQGPDAGEPEVQELLRFVRESQRGLCRGNGGEED